MQTIKPKCSPSQETKIYINVRKELTRIPNSKANLKRETQQKLTKSNLTTEKKTFNPLNIFYHVNIVYTF